jgi:hypothetical protein
MQSRSPNQPVARGDEILGRTWFFSRLMRRWSKCLRNHMCKWRRPKVFRGIDDKMVDLFEKPDLKMEETDV